MKQVWKRRAVVAAVLMLVGTSVYLNWRYAGTVEDSGKKVLGQSALVNGETTDAEVTAAGDDYFATARLSRHVTPPSACCRRRRWTKTPRRTC